VPKQHTVEHKWACIEMCMQFLRWYHEGEPFLQQIIIQDQQIHECAFCWHNDVDSVLHFNELILEHYQVYRQMVSSARYCAMFEEDLKPTVCSKCRGILTNGVVLPYNSFQSHTASVAIKLIQILKFKPPPPVARQCYKWWYFLLH
jgi:hypothetical protein